MLVLVLDESVGIGLAVLYALVDFGQHELLDFMLTEVACLLILVESLVLFLVLVLRLLALTPHPLLRQVEVLGVALLYQQILFALLLPLREILMDYAQTVLHHLVLGLRQSEFQIIESLGHLDGIQ